MPPLVTVVTPVLNGARFLPQALDSVRRQDHPRVEHIVVDGGSTDGTLEILARAPGIAWTTAPDAGNVRRHQSRLPHGQR
jgi:GT2 family glycosyltransferase